MQTGYIHRVLLVIPASRRATAVGWWDEVWGPGQGLATWNVALNPSGRPTDPVTHYWASAGMDAVLFGNLMARLAAAGNLTPPKNWDTIGEEAQLDWLLTTLAPAVEKVGITVVRSEQQGTWADPRATLASLGLRTLEPDP